MYKSIGFFALCLALCVFVGVSQASDESPAFQRLDDMEKVVYGEVKSGGLISRLSDLEKSLFGRELPGTVAERQTAVVNFLEKGSDTQPSLLFKLAIAEWITEQRSQPSRPVTDRVRSLERKLEGEAMGEGPMAMRLERLLGLLITEPVRWENLSLAQGTVVRVALSRTISPSNVAVGDKVKGTLTTDLVIGTHLVAPKGSIAQGTVSKVSKPRSFGRPGEVSFVFDTLLPPSLGPVPLMVGEEAVKAAEAEKAQIAAAGGSLVGALLLGPVGLAGGFLVRGDVKEIPEGTIFHLEVGQQSSSLAYPVPEGLQSLIVPTEVVGAQNTEKPKSEVDSL
ncbi:hypothetical protein [Dethiosulfovibrio salsuginis]|uniref:Uncharacterized protein n=1 Tax=Dethiosulfovibrio salsuginis TaxID=561720 RepID=A0A1X7K5I2_9BACT|nr:hypothetical protein [Dethiosulfovibrio salsuginis]SMG36106.1 hypothetical protein SAMN06275492_12116 [Dethiosulfovibrio salsuginis]